MPDASIRQVRRVPSSDADRSRAHQGRPAPPPRPRIVDACAALAGLGFGAVLAAVITGESRGSLAAPGGMLIAAGRLAGFTGAYLMLIMVMLVARLPWLERSAGQDQLVRWHRRVSPWAIGLIAAHAVLISLGYAQAAKSGALRELWVLVRSYPDMLAAVVGFGLLMLAGFTSYRIVRRRLRYETWWVVHLYFYLALALAFAHQIVTGVSFIGHPLARALWIVIWAATAGMVIVFRGVLPIWRSLRHQLRVVEVRDEAPGVVSVICSGRQLGQLAVSGGQFFLWRFLTRDLWWQAHPYSLSALPRPPYLRLTVKSAGDHSAALARLRPGTAIAVEGPYGTFTRHAQQRPKALLVAAGIGVTALRSLLEDLPRASAPVVILRATREEDLVLRQEVRELVRNRRGQLHELVGSRERVPLDERSLPGLVPDLDRRDVFVCGPEGFVAELVAVAENLGVPGECIHHEAFAL